jgi:type II secretory pathway component PulF
MGSENYELIDTLERIAKSLESLAESQKKIAEALEWIVKDKEVIY